MISAVELFIGLRYMRAKRRTRFVSFITGISVLGIGVGVAALIVILSVMNGFEAELRDRLLSMSSHGHVTTPEGRVSDWQALGAELRDEAGVEATAPLVRFEGMIQAGRELQAVLVHGISPADEVELGGAEMNMLDASLDALVPGQRGIILGRIIAFRIGALPGDSVTLLIPRPAGDGTLEPRLERFVLVGTFEVGLQDHDARLALVHIEDAAGILELGDDVQQVRFRATDVLQSPAVAARLVSDKPGLVASDWTVENASYFRAIRLEKLMMSLILSLIIGVAAFNIVASLVMVVTDKTSDIAVLRTLGMSPRGIVRVFFVQGAAIGWLGVIAGLAAGVVLAINVPDIAPWLEQTLGFQIMPGDVYYVTRIPSVLDTGQLGMISVAAFLLTTLATLYPARRAALVNPALALRYE